MRHLNALTFNDLARIVRSGAWVFGLLFLSGAALTFLQYRSFERSGAATSAKLEFRFGDVSPVERKFYADYLSTLEFSDLSAKVIGITVEGLAYLSVGVPLSGRSDPRLVRVLNGLGAVKAKAVSRLKEERTATSAEISFLTEALPGLSEHTDNATHYLTAPLARQMILRIEAHARYLAVRIADPSVPEMIYIADKNVRRNLVGMIICILSGAITALAGAFVFGYGRLVLK